MATLIAARRYTLEEIERLRAAFKILGYCVMETHKGWDKERQKQVALRYNVTEKELGGSLVESRIRTAMMAGVTADEAEARLRKIREDFAAENRADHPELIEAWAARWLD